MTEHFKQYLITALWAETTDEGAPLDDTYDIEDIDADSLESQEKELEEFISKARA